LAAAPCRYHLPISCLGRPVANAAAAQRALNDATAAHEAAQANFQKSAAASFIKGDPLITVRRAFGSSNPTETFANVVVQVGGNTDAEAGLKRAVVDYVLDRITSTRSATDTEDFLKADAFRRWLRPNAGALKKVIGGQGVQNLDAVAADMRRGAYSGVSAGGSPTATFANAVKRRNLVSGGHGGEATATSVLAVLGEQLGEQCCTRTLAESCWHVWVLKATCGSRKYGKPTNGANTRKPRIRRRLYRRPLRERSSRLHNRTRLRCAMRQ
jgi:hypothetical protein